MLQRGRVEQRRLGTGETAPEAETVTLEGLGPLLADGSAAVAFMVVCFLIARRWLARSA